MADYGLVPRTINSLADRIRGITSDKYGHEERMANLGIQNAQVDANMMGLSGERELRIAQAQRDKFLDEPTTIMDAIKTSKLPDDRKVAILKSMPEDVLGYPTTRRKTFDAFKTIFEEMQKGKRESEKTKIENEQKQLDRESREKIAALDRKSSENRDKDNRVTMQKEVEYISRVKGIPIQSALAEWQKAKSLPERIRLYNNELTALNEDITIAPKDKPAKVEQLRQLYGISDATGNNMPKDLPPLPGDAGDWEIQ